MFLPSLQLVPAYVLVFFRLAGLMLFAPLFGSARIPKRVKVLLCAIMAMGMVPAVPKPVALPDSMGLLAVAIGGEMMFGLAMGMVLSFTFIAAQWAGEIMGQQMGLNLSEAFDPQFGGGGSLVGDLYFMLALVVFLSIGGHRIMLYAVRDSFHALPLLSVGIDRPLFDLLIGLFTACTMLALQLAGPMLVTMLITDVALGFISKTVPAFNVMSAGLALRSLIGMIVLIVGLVLTSSVMTAAVEESLRQFQSAWTGP